MRGYAKHVTFENELDSQSWWISSEWFVHNQRKDDTILRSSFFYKFHVGRAKKEIVTLCEKIVIIALANSIDRVSLRSPRRLIGVYCLTQAMFFEDRPLLYDALLSPALGEIGLLLVVLGFNATLTAKVISWRSVRHMCFLAFSLQY